MIRLRRKIIFIIDGIRDDPCTRFNSSHDVCYVDDGWIHQQQEQTELAQSDYILVSIWMENELTTCAMKEKYTRCVDDNNDDDDDGHGEMKEKNEEYLSELWIVEKGRVRVVWEGFFVVEFQPSFSIFSLSLPR